MNLIPVGLRGYQKSWLTTDVIAGLTLAAVAIPETMGYTTIAQTPIQAGLYTILLPTIVFAVLGSSRLLVVGADSATAAVLAAGLAGLAVTGLTPYSATWLAYASVLALMCGGLLLVARLLGLGFIGDFLSASVLIGFLTGVGIQVFSGQIPDLLGVAKAPGNWFEQQWAWIQAIAEGRLNWYTVAFGLGTIIIITGVKRLAPRVPGAIVAVVLSIVIAASVDAASHGVSLVGAVPKGLPSFGVPQGFDLSHFLPMLAIAGSCFILIIAQSAATSRSFAMKHGDRVDVNRDILGLSGASLAAGLTGTFVVNGSPTKTQILDEQKGRTQLANLVMSVVVLLVLLFLTGLLTDMPHATLAGIVLLIGVSLVDIRGLRRIASRRRSESVIAGITAVVVFTVGVEQGIVLAIVLAIVELVRRQYKPSHFVIGQSADGEPVFGSATPGAQSLPGLVIFRYDADLFYANAARFTDDVEAVVNAAPDPVRWLVLDASAIDGVDYSAGLALAGLIDYVHARNAHFGLAGADPELLDTLKRYGALDLFDQTRVFATIRDVFTAYEQERGATD
ncbi:MAG: SulP family inorganic anion transporter [Humibacillus sp.]|nr:SulP family inorganic anion transporter [Humibacillus sp.]MDN5775751.1 SulP family inorganic anion transporter [Humibacillus sp.]